MTGQGAPNRRNATRVCSILIGLGAAMLLAAAATPAIASNVRRVVRFHGHELHVPRSWRVFNLARAPRTCVRFNRHALYLGVPGGDQNCPAHSVGRTGAALVEPSRAAAASERAAVLGDAPTLSAPRAGLTVIGSARRGELAKILGRRLAPARSAAIARARPSPLVHPMEAVYTGLGFDACSAPSSDAMSAWSSSPFRAVGIYIGGTNEACSQPNLTAGWVSGEVSAGWQLIPTYVGLQGGGSCGGSCATISSIRSRASAQGAADARDAVVQAQALGIPAGNPIYDDLESYSTTASNSAAVLAFLAGWTNQLHAEGYVSGVYSSASSGIATLVRAASTSYTEPDDIWIGDWNGARTTSDPYVPSYDWPDNQRLHQYRGGHDETHGGVTLNIDSDYLGGATADTSSPIPDNTFVEVYGSPNVYRIAGGAPLYVSSWAGFGGAQPVEMLTPQDFAQLPPYPANGTFLTTTTGLVYRVAGGAPILVTDWALFGAPQPSVTVDEWDLQNTTNPLAHLRPAPLDGTVVRGLPSRLYWSFRGGARLSASQNAAAVAVDDQGLAVFPVTTQGSTPQDELPVTCVVPRLRHLSLARARGALRRAHCRAGAVHRPHHRPPGHLLRVAGQSAAPRSRHPAGYRVKLRLR